MIAALHNNPLVRLLQGIILLLLVVLVLEIAWLFLVATSGAGEENRSANYHVESPAIVPMAERSAFETSVERSLFSWNRRPKVTEQQPVSEDSLPSKWLLTGVVNTGNATYAIFTGSEGGQRLRLEEGMYLEKWKLESITAEQVVLSDGEETEVFYLKETGQQQKTLHKNARSNTGDDDTE